MHLIVNGKSYHRNETLLRVVWKWITVNAQFLCSDMNQMSKFTYSLQEGQKVNVMDLQLGPRETDNILDYN